MYMKQLLLERGVPMNVNPYTYAYNAEMFQAVFGSDCKEAKDALKVFLETFTERKVTYLERHPENLPEDLPEDKVELAKIIRDSRIKLFVEFDGKEKAEFDIQLGLWLSPKDFNGELIRRFIRKGMNISSQDSLISQMNLYSKQIPDVEGIVHGNRVQCEITGSYTVQREIGDLIFVEFEKADATKEVKDMNRQEKLSYYILHCAQRDEKVKEIVESDSQIQIFDHRVKQAQKI